MTQVVLDKPVRQLRHRSLREKVVMYTSAHSAATHAVQRINWSGVKDRAVVDGRFFGHRRVKIVTFTVVHSGIPQVYYLSREGVVLQGKPAHHCLPINLNGMPSNHRIALTDRLNQLPISV